MVIGGIILAFIDAQDHGDVFVLGGGGDDDLLGAAFFDMNVGASFALGRVALGIGEDTGGFNHNIHTQIGPVQVGGVFFSEDAHHVTIHHDVAIDHFHVAAIVAVSGVVLKQVGVLFGVKQVIDGDDFQIFRIAFHHCFEDKTANAAKTIDTNFDCHNKPPEKLENVLCLGQRLFFFIAAAQKRTGTLVK